jgi:hypothetical protein
MFAVLLIGNAGICLIKELASIYVQDGLIGCPADLVLRKPRSVGQTDRGFSTTRKKARISKQTWISRGIGATFDATACL